MSAPYNPNIDLQVDRGHGLHLQINGRPVPDSYGAIVSGRARSPVRLPRHASRGASPRQSATSSR
jgi:hypothetical protein